MDTFDQIVTWGPFMNPQPKEKTAYANSKSIPPNPSAGHVSLGSALRVLLFFIPAIALGLVLFLNARQGTDAQRVAAAITEGVFALVWGIVVSGIRLAAQWERGVVLRLGKFRSVRGPGVMYIVPSSTMSGLSTCGCSRSTSQVSR